MTRIAVASVLILLTACMETAAAQQASPRDPGIREVTRTFAITNARVVQAPGRELPRATVVIRDGIIVAVAPDAPVPFDADVIAGDTLVVYAGFIDALGTAGLDVPSVDTSERVPDPDDPPRDRAGILPDRLARHHLDPAHDSVERLRSAGFTAAHSAPGSGLLSGQSAVILLTGERPEEMVLRPDVALVARFSAASGVYPGTPMGVAATLIELFRQTAQSGIEASRYAADPTGRRRPAFDPVGDALRPAAEGRQRVFFVAQSPQEGHRALHLARELDLDLVLAGIPESSMLVDRLRDHGLPVLAPLALPEAVQRDTVLIPADPEFDLARHLGGDIFVTEHRTHSYFDVDDERRVLHERRLIASGLAERNPLTVHEAGIPFAFATLGEVGGVQSNLRRMVEAGLPLEAALAALTTSPAELLGLARTLGTVEAGKLANLTITDGDYFAEDTRVRFVFVDGRRFEIEEAPPEADPDAEITLLGTWDFAIALPDGPISGFFRFTGTPDAPSGLVEIQGLGSLAIADVSVDGNRVTFALPDAPPGTVRVTGIVVGDEYRAEMTVPGMPTLSFTATRRPN